MAAAECAVFTGTGGKNVYRPTMGCVTASACRGGSGVRAVNNANECVTASAEACFQDGGLGFTSGTGCVTAAAGTCSMTAGYRFDSGTNACVALITCSGGTPIINSAQSACVASCAAGEGLSAMSGAGRRCIAAASATAAQCVNNGAVLLADRSACADRCIANNAPANGQCGVATTVCATTDGYNTGTRTCVTSGQTAATCQALAMRVLQTGGNCAAMCADNNAPNASGQCGTATSVCTGAQGYDSGTNTCIAAGSVGSVAQCSVFSSKNVYRPSTGCVTASACRGDMGAVNANECVTASAQTCFTDEGRGFSSSSCVTASSAADCSEPDGFVFDDVDMCIPLVTDISVSFGNEAVGNEKEALNAWYGTSHATLADAQAAHTPGTQHPNLTTLKTNLAAAGNSSGIATNTGYQTDGTEIASVTDAQLYQRSRYIYANQPALDQVGGGVCLYPQ